MQSFTIMSVFDVSSSKHPLGPDVLAQAWGEGHRFSYCDGLTLTLVVELTAADQAAASKSLVSRAQSTWQALGHGTLGPTMTLRIQSADETPQVPAGVPPAEPEETRRRKRHKSARQLKYFGPPDDYSRFESEVGDLPDDGESDDGGLAGVREPRRPRPGPPGAAAAQAVPPTNGDQILDLHE